jgi:hypothetical protein
MSDVRNIWNADSGPAPTPEERRLESLLAGMPRRRCPSRVREGVLAQLRSEGQGPREAAAESALPARVIPVPWFRRHIRILLEAAATLALVVVGAHVYRSLGPELTFNPSRESARRSAKGDVIERLSSGLRDGRDFATSVPRAAEDSAADKDGRWQLGDEEKKPAPEEAEGVAAPTLAQPAEKGGRPTVAPPAEKRGSPTVAPPAEKRSSPTVKEGPESPEVKLGLAAQPVAPVAPVAPLAPVELKSKTGAPGPTPAPEPAAAASPPESKSGVLKKDRPGAVAAQSEASGLDTRDVSAGVSSAIQAGGTIQAGDTRSKALPAGGLAGGDRGGQIVSTPDRNAPAPTPTLGSDVSQRPAGKAVELKQARKSTPAAAAPGIVKAEPQVQLQEDLGRDAVLKTGPPDARPFTPTQSRQPAPTTADVSQRIDSESAGRQAPAPQPADAYRWAFSREAESQAGAQLDWFEVVSSESKQRAILARNRIDQLHPPRPRLPSEPLFEDGTTWTLFASSSFASFESLVNTVGGRVAGAREVVVEPGARKALLVEVAVPATQSQALVTAANRKRMLAVLPNPRGEGEGRLQEHYWGGASITRSLETQTPVQAGAATLSPAPAQVANLTLDLKRIDEGQLPKEQLNTVSNFFAQVASPSQAEPALQRGAPASNGALSRGGGGMGMGGYGGFASGTLRARLAVEEDRSRGTAPDRNQRGQAIARRKVAETRQSQRRANPVAAPRGETTDTKQLYFVLEPDALPVQVPTGVSVQTVRSPGR